MTESYADTPISISEARADREGIASVARPRDALISVLRQIDSGEMNIDSVVVFYRERVEDGKDYKTHYHIAGGDGLHDTLGLIERAKYMVLGAV